MKDVLAVIIDSAYGTRHLDNTLSYPTALKSLDSAKTLLDWVLHALDRCGINRVIYVGGYHIQKVIEQYPNLSFRFHAAWQSQGEIAGLKLAIPNRPMNWIIVRSNTVCLPEAVNNIIANKDDISVGYYGNEKNPQFTGILTLPAKHSRDAFSLTEAISQQDPKIGIEEWLAMLKAERFPVKNFPLNSFAAPISDPIAVARTLFGGKGRTLEQLRPLVKNAKILSQIRFNTENWKHDKSGVLSKIENMFPNTKVVVRSSSSTEDTLERSEAGRFKTVLDVPVNCSTLLSEAIEEVVRSFSSEGRASTKMDEILIQPYLSKLSASGVVLTRDPETGGPYYVINIDRTSGRSDTVTAGSTADIDSIFVARNTDLSDLDKETKACLSIAQELTDLTHLDNLDIEFGIDHSGQIFLFQVRPIATKSNKFQLADDDIAGELDQIRKFLDTHMRPHPTMLGETTILGTMPDWNPAEMIGTVPRPLALSLYQRLIGNQTWSAARSAIGYRDVRPVPLIVSLSGRPYVDVRASFNSFLPKDLDDSVGTSWVNHCLSMLDKNGSLHDKVEFEVAITCLTFNFDQDVQRLLDAGLSSAEVAKFRKALLSLTDKILTGNVVSIQSERAQLYKLSKRREHWMKHRISGSAGLARRIDTLLSDCEIYGVLPFSILARYAFIATSLLHSLKSVGIFSDEDSEKLLRSIPTVASQLSNDLREQSEGSLSKETFLESYGHLRPGSYDITSPNYRSSPEYLSSFSSSANSPTHIPNISEAKNVLEMHTKDIQHLLKKCGFTASVTDFSNFILNAIPAREWAKFEFMKSVDASLEDIAELGDELGLTRDDMSYMPINQLVRGALESPSGATLMESKRIIEFNKKRWNLTGTIRLPHLIRTEKDIGTFQQESWTPNFVSSKRVVAPPVVIEAGESVPSLAGRIILIRAADPGFDWIFGHPIAGLITEFGGIASHMAIRAAEFGLPAAIGCGELIFNHLRNAALIELDCSSKRILRLS